MRRSLFLFVLGTALLFMASGVLAQDAGKRSQDLAASLDKTKYKKKEKRGFSFEFYIEIKNVPATRSDASQYSGHYWADEYLLDLRHSSSGSAEGSGYDRSVNGAKQRSFTLQDLRIDGALLTATKVYENGETKPFEAVFVERTVAQGKNVNAIERRETSFGLGFIERGHASVGGTDNDWTNRVFLERK